jgi:hypothetical protein
MRSPPTLYTPANHKENTTMYKPFTVIALSTCLLWLTACDKTPTAQPTPIVNQPVPAESGATAGSGANTSVPPAESVFPPANAAQAEPVLKETDGTRKPAQEPEAMPVLKPMPGQNNDHSAPLSTDQ